MYDHSKESLFEACGFDRSLFMNKIKDIVDDMVERILNHEQFKLSTILEKIYHRAESQAEAILMTWVVSSAYDEAHRARRALTKMEKKTKIASVIQSATWFVVFLILLILTLHWFTDLFR
jgi:hypothetical protein